ncbi:hypothetical protein GF318_01000 [Candidatus Micrarchaeota archaeon]|nr:hypothetical protein [Candidatus Micrarchaeota archaeon]
MKKMFFARVGAARRINPRFRSSDRDPAHDRKFVDALKGIVEGRTPWVHSTFLGQIVVKTPEGLGSPELRIVGIVERKMDFSENFTPEESRKVVDTLFARYLVRKPSERESAELRPLLLGLGQRFLEDRKAGQERQKHF